MGNSPDHFIGPETPGVPANRNEATKAFNSFRDATGRILRQGARFRVFEYDVDSTGALLNPHEVALGNGISDIEWRVHIANRKASFFAFDGQNGAKDTYAARSALPANDPLPLKDPPCKNRRNSGVDPALRSATLEIDPGEALISQRVPGPIELTNPSKSIPIDSLGTLRLDPEGRLIVLGGYGQSNPSKSSPLPITDYANNDTWFDDAGDGSVKARVILSDGTAVDADPAWVFVGPPKFAPGLDNVVRLLDTLFDVAVRDPNLPAKAPKTPMFDLVRQMSQAWQSSGGKTLAGFVPSFTRDIQPILKRALDVRDVHVSGNGGDTKYHRSLVNRWTQLSALDGPNAADGQIFRQKLFAWMRDPDSQVVAWDLMPRGLGDDYTSLDNNPKAPNPNCFLSLTHLQYALLREWAAGRFVPDWPGQEPVVGPKENPSADDLDQAALEHSVGGPFYPGIEVSWLIRTPGIYSEPLRFLTSSEPELKTQPIAVGALDFKPGFFSQQMALPWQADFYDCHAEDHEDPTNRTFSFMWWSAQRPDSVFPANSKQDDVQVRWVRDFDKAANDPDDPENFLDHTRFAQMQQNWTRLKFISVFNLDHWEEEPS